MSGNLGLRSCIVFLTEKGYVTCTPQASMLPVVDLEVIIRQPQLPTAGSASLALARWTSAAGEDSESFALGLDGSLHPAMYRSTDGTTQTLKSVSAAAAGNVPVRLRYNHSTGDFTAEQSTDSEVSWSAFTGSPQNFGAGSLFAADRRVPFTVGGRNETSLLRWNGPLSSVEIHDGIGAGAANAPTIAICDFSHVWADESWMDPYGNTWTLQGEAGVDYEWRLTEAAVQGLTGDLATTGSLVDRLVTPASHSSSTDAGLWTPALVAASQLAVGQVYAFELHGAMDMAVGSVGANIRCRVNGTTHTEPATTVCVPQTSGAGLVGGRWHLSGEIYIEALGSGGQISTERWGQTIIGVNSAGALGSAIHANEAWSMDLSGGLQFSVTGVAGSGGAGNVLYLKRASLRRR